MSLETLKHQALLKEEAWQNFSKKYRASIWDIVPPDEMPESPKEGEQVIFDACVKADTEDSASFPEALEKVKKRFALPKESETQKDLLNLQLGGLSSLLKKSLGKGDVDQNLKEASQEALSEAGGHDVSCKCGGHSHRPKPPTLSEEQKEKWLKNPVGAALDRIIPGLSPNDQKEFCLLVDWADETSKILGNEAKVWGTWIRANCKEFLGEKWGKKFDQEIDNVASFFSAGDRKRRTARALAIAIPTTVLAPTLIALPAAFAAIALLAGSLVRAAKDWKEKRSKDIMEQSGIFEYTGSTHYQSKSIKGPDLNV